MSTTKVVRLENFARELKGFSKLSLDKKRKAVASGVARSIPDLVAASPVDTGLYAASWDFTVEEKSVIVGNYAPYAGVIEYGTRPFTPPIAPLLAWAKRVLTGQVNTKGVGKGQMTGSFKHETYSSEVWALAVHTQKKIAEFGMQPHHIMENEIPKIIENIKEEMKRL